MSELPTTCGSSHPARWAGLFAMLGVAAACPACCKGEVKLSDADQRDLLVTAADLQPWLGGHSIDPAREKLESSYSLGSNEYDYTYETDELMIYSSLHLEDSESEAASTYSMLGLGANIGLSDKDIQRIPCDASLSWGDESKCERMETDGIQLGAIVRVRQGRFAFFAVWAGPQVPTPTQASKVIDAHVAAFAKLPSLAKK